MSRTLQFIDSQHSAFFSTVRKRVDTYFHEKSLSKKANAAMWAKAMIMMTTFLGLYGLTLVLRNGSWLGLGLAIGLGISCALVGFNVSHDAIHGAFSSNRNTNRFLGFSFYLIGANPYMWNISHNMAHHTYTNIAGYDEDIEIAPGLIRLSTQEKVRYFHRYQHYYAFLLYGLASLSWVFRKDYVKFFKGPKGTHPRIEYFHLFFYKILYYFLFLLLPFLLLPITWWQLLLGFAAMHLFEGLVLGLVFQLAHIVEGTTFPLPSRQGNVAEAWAVHQMHTTANFAPQSRLANFLTGGLNHQIEHHLFPNICHIHYPAIAGIVKQTALEFNLPYLENASFFSALASHYRLLRKLGKEASQLQRREGARPGAWESVPV